MRTREDIFKGLLQKFESSSIFQQLYGRDPSVLEYQINRYTDIITGYYHQYTPGEIHLFSTPGRTEISGNHTDHNHGRVLAASVNLDSIAAVANSEKGKISLYSEAYKRKSEIDLSDLSFKKSEQGTTTAIIRGIAARFKELNYKIGGFNAFVSSEVMVGSGLSSSASIEVLIGTILNYLFNDGKISPVEIAKIGQYAENVYFGKPCGLMDQIACAVGGIVMIDFKNPSNPLVKKVAFNFEDKHYKLLVVDSGGNHADLTDDYASIPAEMKALAKALGKEYAREISHQELMNNLSSIRKKVGDRAILRGYHFIRENERVLRQVEALERDDFTTFLELVNASGNSSNKWLQNCYSIKNVTEQGVNLALAVTEEFLEKIGKGACRVHGGGFAGTIQTFIPESNVDEYQRFMENIFGAGSVKVLNIRQIGTTFLGSGF